MKHFIWMLVCILLSGCGEVDNRPVRAPVRGVVTIDGKPLKKGSVVFHPTSGQRQARGAIREDGTYELTTFDKGDGAIVGESTVTIMSNTILNPMMPNERLVWHFPDEHAKVYSSKIKRTVVAGETNVIDFDSNEL